jgi:hypothetical protein
MLASSKKIADRRDIDSGIMNIGFFKLFDQNKWLGNEFIVGRNELKVVDASAVYKYLLGPGKETKKWLIV